jgi:proline iminopeptidase
MTHPDPAVRDAASYAWREWEDHHVSIGANGVRRDRRFDEAEHRQVFATLVTHYWAHDAFLDPPILERMRLLHGIPATLIHGRRDVSGPAVVAWRLHRAWPGSELLIEEGEGHGGPSMVEAWCSANSRHADRIDVESATSAQQ